MPLDRKEVERMLKQSSGDHRAAGQPKVDSTPEFEEYTAPPRLDENGRPVHKSGGLKAAGYEFPPKDPAAPTPPMTKANLAKGIGVPDVPRSSPGSGGWPVPALPGQQPPKTFMETKQDKPANPALPPPSEMVDDTGLFEVYQRPGLKEHPRTGRGLRSDPPRGPTAGEILARMPEPKAEVVTPKRFAVYEPTTPKPSPAATPEEQAEAEAAHDAAHLDAAADVAATTAASANAHMSHSVENGPIKTVIQHGRHEDRVIESPPPSPSPLPPSATAPVSQPHFSDAPRPAPAAPRGAAGKTCRIALVQSTFNLAITDAMVGNAHKEAERLGCPIVAHLRVPGAFDTPLAAQRLLQRGDVDAVVVIGCIIQGETGHDELIAHATARTLHELALRTDKPVGLAVTGPRMTEAQAWARLDAAAFAVGSVLEQHVLRA